MLAKTNIYTTVMQSFTQHHILKIHLRVFLEMVNAYNTITSQKDRQQQYAELVNLKHWD